MNKYNVCEVYKKFFYFIFQKSSLNLGCQITARILHFSEHRMWPCSSGARAACLGGWGGGRAD